MAGEYSSSGERLVTNERREKIATFISDVLKPAKKTLKELEIQEHSISDFESRDYQIEAWDALWQARENGADRGLIHLATGLGKTSIAVFDYAKFRNEQIAKGETAKCLFVVHQNNILEQASDRFSEVLPELKNVRIQGYKVDSGAELNFATFQTLTNNIEKIPPNAFDYIIYDEAHHIEADTYKKVVEHFNPKFQLGLTATPERMDEKDITNHFGEALYTKTLPEALAEGYLASVRYTPMYDEAVIELINSGFSAEKLDQLGQLLEVEPRNEEIVKNILEKQQEIRDKEDCENVKTIIFCADTNHADSIAEMMSGESYHSSKNTRTNDEILDRFRNNGLETITVRDMFNEGVDIPDARLVVFLRTTQSKTIFEQQLGRGLRKTGDKTQVDVLDFVANIERLGMANELSEDVKKISSRLGTRNGDYIEGNKERSEVADIDRFDFQFSPQVVGFLKNYRFLIESRQSRTDWKKYSDGEIVSLALEKKPSVPLSRGDMNSLSKNREFPSSSFVEGRFGSVKNFQRACGFEVSDRIDWNEYSNEELVSLALKISHDAPLASREIVELSKNGEFTSKTDIIKRFSSIVNFQNICGFNVVDRSNVRNLSNGDLITIALEVSPSQPLDYNAIDELCNEGRFLNPNAVTKRFGSLRGFQQACGFEVSDRIDARNLSNEELINLALEINPNNPLDSRKIQNLSSEGKFASLATISSRFGSIVAFQRACGFEVTERTDWNEYSDEELIKLALEKSPSEILSIRAITKLNEEGVFAGYDHIRNRFGSLFDFQRACGFEVTERTDWNEYSDDELIKLALEKSPSEPLSISNITELNKDGAFPGVDHIKRRFGSIVDFQRVCGFKFTVQRDRTDWSDYTNKELIDVALKKSPNAPLSQPVICALSKNCEFPSKNHIINRFGSIVAFQRACGFEVTERTDWNEYSDDELIKLALEKSPEIPITQSAIKAFSKNNEFPSCEYISKRFVSLVDFQRACGFEVADRIDWSEYTDEELVNLVVKKCHDAPISQFTIDKLSKNGEFPSRTIISRRFDSFSNFQQACRLNK